MPPESVRSRSGCVTCRKRRKKCDENFADPNHVGICNRCYGGSFPCERSEHPPRRRTKPKIQAEGQAAASPQVDLNAQLSVSPSATPPLPLSHEPYSPLASTSTLPAVHYHPLPQQHPLALAHGPTSFPEIDSEGLTSFFESLDDMPSFVGEDLYGNGTNVGLASSTSLSPRTPHVEGAGCNGSEEGPSLRAEDEGGERVSPLYGKFNNDYLCSVPKPIRDLMTARLSNVASSHELTRAASLALVLLYRVRSQEGGPEKQEELIKQSNSYFSEALLRLQSDIPLEAQLVAVLDLQFHQHDQSGAAAVRALLLPHCLGSCANVFVFTSKLKAYAILLIGEFFIKEARGPNPPLDLSSLSGVSNVALGCFAYTDVLASMCMKHRRTIFNIAGLPGDDLSSPSTPPQLAQRQTGDLRLDSHLGLPVGLLLCLAAISNLSVDMAGMDADLVRAKANKIEEAIRNWRLPPPLGGPLETSNSLLWVEEVKTSEMWRQTALIHLFQSVHNLGPLAPVLRHSLSQMLALGHRPGATTDTEDSLWAGSLRACPWFMAATISVLPDEREKCRQGLRQCGPQKGYTDNLEAAESIWGAVDASGSTVPWKDWLEKEGLVVAFL
ncbi:hypothetical protein P7C70_g845, partial [Phenoliferia sp. Uapishka_3]